MTSLTELLLMIISLKFIPRSLWPFGSIKVGLKALLAGVVMALPVWFMQHHGYTLLVILPVAAFVYFGAATLLGTIPRDDMRAFYSSIRHKAGRGKADLGQDETTSSDLPFLTEEDMRQEREFALVLGHEMTNPLLPAFKSGMTNPLLPAFKSEMTHILPTYESEVPLPNTSYLSVGNEIPDQVTIKLTGTPDPSMINEIPDQATTKLADMPNPSVIDDERTIPLLRTVRLRKKGRAN
jgi:hypothetical protein